MKNDWKEEFYKVFEINQGSGRINGYITKNVGEDYSRPATVEDFEMYVEALLAEQKKELMEECINIVKGVESYCIQPTGYCTEEQEKEIYLTGFDDMRAFKLIKLILLRDKNE